MFSDHLGRQLGQLAVEEDRPAELRVLGWTDAGGVLLQDGFELLGSDDPGIETAAGVRGVRIGQPEREGIHRGASSADKIAPLRGPLVPQADFGSVGVPAQLDPVGFDHMPPGPELEAPLSLVHQDPGVPQPSVLEPEAALGDDLRQGTLRPVERGIVDGDRNPPGTGLLRRAGGSGPRSHSHGSCRAGRQEDDGRERGRAPDRVPPESLSAHSIGPAPRPSIIQARIIPGDCRPAGPIASGRSSCRTGISPRRRLWLHHAGSVA
jgi:hypothetical protein